MYSETATVYVIRNTRTGRAYVGMSRSDRKRFATHRNMLRLGKHPAQALQSDWLQYGESAFRFETLELCQSPALAMRRETEMLHRLAAQDGVYNVYPRKPKGRRRPLLDGDTRAPVRLLGGFHPDTLRAIDEYATQAEITRACAIARLVEHALGIAARQGAPGTTKTARAAV